MNRRDDLYTITVTTNFVLVPVTVKDDGGHLVDGLLPKDFSVFEDGRKEPLKFFTSDPFPLSAAIVLVMNGPLGPQGPTVNGVPVERPGAQPNIAPPKDVRVLNDAILRAALDLSKRDRARRKIIFVISDGREYGSRVSYSDVLKVLLSREVTVYAIGVESASIPVYSKLQKLHLPHYGYGDILPRYTGATGGEVISEFSRDNIELAYARATLDARNQ